MTRIRDYRPPWWLPGGHTQTIWPAVIAPRARIVLRRERWPTPDGDFIDVDRTVDPTGSAAAPREVLCRGLEGDSGSPYSLAVMAAAAARGWRGAVPHFRGCSGELNRAPRAYHSGDSAEIDWILRRFAAEPGTTGAPLFAAGVSLGGNALLKWLGERNQDAAFVAAAAAVCPPQDLQAGARALAGGFSLLYTRNFLKTLKQKSLGKLAQYPGLFDRERMLGARDFFDFDDAVTAPMHGFSSCYDYWTRSSCRQFLADIRVPTRVLNALNDPFIPVQALAAPSDVSRQVELHYPAQGGHVGFQAGGGRSPWLADYLMGFFDGHR
ncbi:MAG: alpha/beta fold hydrolase [Burkholderiales bacterium]|nr:alpha/beta fold hydrolase [Burkholderiales bacterium]